MSQQVNKEGFIKFLKTIFLAGIVLLTGCASTITGKPGDADGIAYYLPKPYLLITKNIGTVDFQTEHTPLKVGEKEVMKITRTPKLLESDKGGDFYQFQVIYLPDMAQPKSTA